MLPAGKGLGKHFWTDFTTAWRRKLLGNFGEHKGTLTNIFSRNAVLRVNLKTSWSGEYTVTNSSLVLLQYFVTTPGIKLLDRVQQ